MHVSTLNIQTCCRLLKVSSFLGMTPVPYLVVWLMSSKVRCQSVEILLAIDLEHLHTYCYYCYSLVLSLYTDYIFSLQTFIR